MIVVYRDAFEQVDTLCITTYQKTNFEGTEMAWLQELTML
jgi:hypothetical protein